MEFGDLVQSITIYFMVPRIPARPAGVITFEGERIDQRRRQRHACCQLPRRR